MPMRPPRACKAPGCPRLVQGGGWCEQHQVQGKATSLEARRAFDEARGTAAARGYGHRWRKLRIMKLRLNPLCQWAGCTEIATDVDHVVPKRRGGLDELENLQSLCHSHHSQKTAAGD